MGLLDLTATANRVLFARQAAGKPRSGNRLLSDRILAISGGVLVLCIAAAWVLYGLFGRSFIQSIYDGESIGMLNRLMDRGRGEVPVESYLKAADRIMWAITFWASAAFVAFVAFVRDRLGASLLVVSFLLSSILFFLLFEFFPSLVEPLHLSRIPYYAQRLRFVPDDRLVFRYRPFYSFKPNPDFKGDNYSPRYGVEVAAMKYESRTTDEDGFLNNGNPGRSDVLVLGDSFIEFGLNEEDDFPMRLQRASGLRTANFGVGGYGPFQYVELLRTHGIRREPRYALMAISGGDIGNIRNYLKWKTERNSRWKISLGHFATMGASLSGSFWQRYMIVLDQTADLLKNTALAAVESAWGKFFKADEEIHPDLAVLKLGADRYTMLFSQENNSPPPKAIAESPHWKALREVLWEFKAVSDANHIVPMVLYIPTAAEIYAGYSTQQSGENWLTRRDFELAAKGNAVKGLTMLAREVGIEVIDLTPAYETQARSGRLLYYPFDIHWNSDGRQVAAEYVAATLRKNSISASDRAHASRRGQIQ